MCLLCQIWPYKKVHRGQYRLRLLNACFDSGVNLTFNYVGPNNDSDSSMPNDYFRQDYLHGTPLQFHFIASDQGYLNEPVPAMHLSLYPGERYQIVIDFSQVPPGSAVYLSHWVLNTTDGRDDTDSPIIMKFIVDGNVRPTVPLPQRINRIPPPARKPGTITRWLPIETYNLPTLTGEEDRMGGRRYIDPPTEILTVVCAKPDAVAPRAETLRHWTSAVMGSRHEFVGAACPMQDETELWFVPNWTVDTHTVHLHLPTVRLLLRHSLNGTTYMQPRNQCSFLGQYIQGPMPASCLSGAPIFPEPWEAGWKDTFQVPPFTAVLLIVSVAKSVSVPHESLRGFCAACIRVVDSCRTFH